MSTRVDQPGRFFTNAELRVIWEATNMAEVRDRHRRADSVLFALLTEVAQSAYAVNAVPGHETRQRTASEERSTWTINQLSNATRRAPRTIRHDIELGELKATRPGHAWAIDRVSALAYIASHQTT